MGLKRISHGAGTQGKGGKAPRADAVIVAKEGAEATAYREYLRLTGERKTADLYTGSEKEGIRYAAERNAKCVLVAEKEGVKRL